VELVGHDDRVGEEAADEGPVGIGHVDRDRTDVLTPGNGAKSVLQFRSGAAMHHLHEVMVLLVDDNGDEVAKA